MASSGLPGVVFLVGDRIKVLHAQIRDHLESPKAVMDWLVEADQNLEALIQAAQIVHATEEMPSDER